MPPLLVAKIGCLVTLLTLANTADAEKRFYPLPAAEPLEIGDEDFRERYLTLRNLEGLYVDFTVIRAAGKDLGITVPDTLYMQAQQKIEAAGLLFLSKDERLLTPGQPIMNLWPAYKGEARSNSGEDQNNMAYEACEIPDSCTVSLWAGFEQSASLLRQPENQYMLSTWGGGDNAKTCQDRGDWMATAVLAQLDNFIADYKKAQLEPDPVVVGSTSDVPQHCSQSWVTHLNVFATNESRINKEIKPILDRLHDVAARCNNFSYVIETHADQRADTNYNKLLTEARARSIKHYLISKGMDYHRIYMRPLGESVPIATGSTEADHAKNRRVVIIPMRQEDIVNSALEIE